MLFSGLPIVLRYTEQAAHVQAPTIAWLSTCTKAQSDVQVYAVTAHGLAQQTGRPARHSSSSGKSSPSPTCRASMTCETPRKGNA